MALRQGFVVQSDADGDAPTAPAVGTVSTVDQAWDGGAFGLGAAAAAAGSLWVDRPYWTGTPAVGWLVERVDQSTGAGAIAQLGNEQNLAAEGWSGGPSAWFQFEDAVRAAAAQPERLIAMPPSPGVAGWESWVRRPGDHACHAYGSAAEMRSTVEWFLGNTDGRVYLTECNFGAGRAVDVDAWATGELAPFLDWCSSQPRVVCCLYFAWRWHGAPELPTPVDAAGTAVEAVVRDWTAPMAGGGLPWAGKVLTVWNCPADPAEVVAWGDQLGLDGFEIKTADGSSSWLDSPSRHLSRAYVDALRAGGRFRVMGWSYNYCDGRSGAGLDRGDGVPELEAEAAARGVDELGLDGHCFDLEAECEGHGDLVAILLSEGRRLIARPLAAHTWAYRTGHATYPWGVIGSGVDALRPMIYRPVWTAAGCWAELGEWFEGRLVCPVLGLTEAAATVEVLAADAAYALAEGCPGLGFWELSGLPGQPGVAAWIADLEIDGAPAPEPPEPADQLAALQDRTWALLDQLQAAAGEFAALDWPSAGAGIGAAAEAAKSLVRASKGEQ